MTITPFLTLLSPGAGAVQHVVVSSYTGVPIYLKVFAIGSDTIQETTGPSVESTNDKGEHRIGVATGDTGIRKIGIYRASDDALLDRQQVVLGGSGTTSYAYPLSGDQAADAAAIAAAVQERLADIHGAGSWVSDDSRLVMVDALVESVVNSRTVILTGGENTYADAMYGRIVLTYDTTDGDKISGNTVESWDAALRQVRLRQEPPFALAVNDRVVILAVRDTLYSPTGPWVHQ